MNVVIAIDKFKGCATSWQLAEAIKDSIIEKHHDATVTIIPIADGGDGTLNALEFIGGNRVKRVTVRVKGPLPHLPSVDAQYLLDKEKHEAYVELATASGLALVPHAERDVMHASTASTGVVLAHAINRGARHIILGLGGSATTDCGMGLLWSLGVRFLDSDGNSLAPCGKNMMRVKSIDTSGLSPCVFAPQKGATARQVKLLDNGLRNMASLMPDGVAHMRGAGAAGGVAAGMLAFLNAEIVPGAQALLDMAGFDSLLDNAQLVITGEGRFDSQTLMGKAPWVVMIASQSHGVPVVALCGSVEAGLDTSQLGFEHIIAVTPPSLPLEEAMDTATALELVKETVRRIL